MNEKRELLNKILGAISETVYLYRAQKFASASKSIKVMIKLIIGNSENVNECFQFIGSKAVTLENMNNILKEIVRAQEQQDYILTADLLEMQLYYFFEAAVQGIVNCLQVEEIDYWDKNKEVLEERGENKLVKLIQKSSPREGTKYEVEFASNGGLTLKLCEGQLEYYMESNSDQRMAAQIFAEANCTLEEEKYILYGAGMLYYAEAILEENLFAEVEVIESDAYILKLALTYRDLSELLKEKRLKIRCESALYISQVKLDEKIKLLMHQPSIRHIDNVAQREICEKYFVQYSSMLEQNKHLIANFKRNVLKYSKCVDEVNADFAGKRMVLVAGGPSLDKSVDFLKKKSNYDLLLCVGTAAARLAKEKIKPDYIMITDASPLMLEQLKNGMFGKEVRLLFLSTTFWKAVDFFEGEKYLVFQEGFSAAELLAKQRNVQLYTTGGSVSTTSLELGIRFKCKEITCIGLDLAFTGGMSHAKGTLSAEAVGNQRCVRVTQSVISGKTVATSKTFQIYKDWIEKRIQNEKDIKFINISDGAYIEGMKNISCEDIEKNI